MSRFRPNVSHICSRRVRPYERRPSVLVRPCRLLDRRLMTDVPSPTIEVKSDSFSFPHPTLFCARVRLYEEWLELTGWRLWGRYRRRIPLYRILHADAAGATDLVLWLADGRTLRLRVDDAPEWRRAINRRIDAD